MSSVHVVKVGEMSSAMDALVSELIIHTPRKIAIKLNLCDYRTPETGVVSDPTVVESMLRSLRRRYPNADLLLVENNGSIVMAVPMFSYLGLDKLASMYGASVFDVSKDRWIVKRIDGYRAKYVEVPRILQDCDLIISHPKLKTHSSTKITCSLKNMFGCYRGNKSRYHEYLDEAIVDINLAIRPSLSIVDAVICHQGICGPILGRPKRLGLLIGGRDLVAVDSFCAQLAGFNPYFVGHIRKAADKGLGQLNYALHSDLTPIGMRGHRLEFNRFLFYLLKVVRSRGRLWE